MGKICLLFTWKSEIEKKQSDDTIHEPFVSNMNLVSALKLKWASMILKVTHYSRNKIIKELWSWKKVIICLHRLPKPKDASLYKEQKEEKKKAKRRPLAFYHLPLCLVNPS